MQLHARENTLIPAWWHEAVGRRNVTSRQSCEELPHPVSLVAKAEDHPTCGIDGIGSVADLTRMHQKRQGRPRLKVQRRKLSLMLQQSTHSCDFLCRSSGDTILLPDPIQIINLQKVLQNPPETASQHETNSKMTSISSSKNDEQHTIWWQCFTIHR
jgi:hypothetical protein